MQKSAYILVKLSCLACLVAGTVAWALPSAQAGQPVELWDSTRALPEKMEDIPPIPYAEYSYVERGEEGEYQYLHETGLEWFGGRLFAGWSNAARDESAPDKKIRGKYSDNGGKTWSEAFTMAPESEGDERREYANLALVDGDLWLFTTRIHSGWSFADPKLEGFVLEDDAREWSYQGILTDDGFVATDKPKQMDNGRWIIAGMRKRYEDDTRIGENRIAISEPGDVTSLKVSGIPHPENMRFPFVSFIMDGSEITAIMRNSKDTFVKLSTSSDYGETWTMAEKTNLPSVAMKPFAGKLSTGQRYFITGYPRERGDSTRHALVIYVSEPGEEKFSKVWRISRGKPYAMRFEGRGKGPGPSQWSYPKAVEHDGRLYVIYTVNKEDAEMAVIPIEALN